MCIRDRGLDEPDDIAEKEAKTENFKKAIHAGIFYWERGIDLQYGDLLRNCEIIEDQELIYFCSLTGKKLIAGWNTKSDRWVTGVKRQELDGLAFSTPRRFEEIVFEKLNKPDGYYKKQCLVEYLLLGILEHEKKDLHTTSYDGNKVEFTLSDKNWNSLIIGIQLEVEIYCKIINESEGTELIELCLLYASDPSVITLEMISGDPGRELFSHSSKGLGGYYTQK